MYGFIESEFDPRDLEFTKDEHIRSEELPNMYNYTKFANLKVKDQGKYPTCVPTSISTMIEAMDYECNWDIMDIYNRRPEPQGEGMQIRDALKMLKNDCGDPHMKYYRLRSILQIKWSLIANGPCILALPVRSMDFEFWRGSDNFGGHAVACVGYDEEGLIIQNSWGTSWGNYGLTKLPYNQINYIIEAWGIV